MQKSTTALETPLRDQLDRLAAFEPSDDAPVLSLYLDMRPNEHGRDQFQTFLRKTFVERARMLTGPARASFDRDVEHITTFLDTQVKPSTNGLAIFACDARNLFEAAQLTAPIEAHWLFLGSVPHLYPLARVNDQYPRYAALVVDTNAARLFVFSLGSLESRRQVQNVKTRKSMMGGWAQARYQRHLANFHLHHMKEVVDLLDRTVRDEGLTQVILACDEVARPALMAQLPAHLAEKIVDVVKLDARAPEHDVLRQTLDALREKDADTDAAHVRTLFDAWLSGGLGVVGPDDTLSALARGQVEELLIAASPAQLQRAGSPQADLTPGPVDVDTSTAGEVDADLVKLADELVTKAQQNSARIRFVENPDLLKEVGGVGAILRFRI